MIKNIAQRMLGRAEPEVCGVGGAYSESHHRHCTEKAVIRTTTHIGDDVYESVYCEDHSSWPFWDRSRWLAQNVSVEKLEGGEWVDWTDFPIRTPTQHRTISESERMQVDYHANNN